MAEIICENQNDIVMLRVIGGVTFAEIAEAVKEHFPKVTRHLLWDYTHGNLDNVTADDCKKITDLSAKYFVNRKFGRTAFACPDQCTYGMFRMYTAFADIKGLPYEYAVHRNFENALEWVMDCSALEAFMS
jgi:hypothetical protein